MSGTADGAVGRVADWLAKEYGELLDRDPPGYWEFQARELLDVMADTTAGEAESLVGVLVRSGVWPLAVAERAAAALAARSGGAQDAGLRARIEALIEEARFNRLRGPQGFVLADDLRRALAGPDDARQDGAG